MIRGLIFDLDGTLTEPGLIDFAAMRAAIGCPTTQTILEYVEDLRQLDHLQAAIALEEVDRREKASALSARPAPYLDELLRFLSSKPVARAIITRNSPQSTILTLHRLDLLSFFDPIVTRDDARPKPHPDGLLKIADRWSLPVDSLAIVGDFWHDIQAGLSAGITTILCSNSDRYRSFPVSAHHRVQDLRALIPLLEKLIRLPLDCT